MDVRKEDLSDDKDSRGRMRRRQVNDGGGGDGGAMDGCCGEGRVWIFLVLGILALVFSVVLMGIDMNVRSLTSSVDSVEVMPPFIQAAAGGLSGLLVLLLFWKRYKVLVYAVLVMCAVTVIMCVIAAVLTGTHVLQPLLNASGCVYSRRDKMCRCSTTFRRDKLELERVKDGEQAYLVMQEVSSCGDVEDVLPGMLFTTIGIYGVVSLVCVVSGVISLLVYQTEQRRKYQEEELEDDTYSAPSSPSGSDNYAEHHTMLPTQSTSHSNVSTLINIYTNPNTTAHEEDNNTNDDGNTTPSDLIYSPADVPMGYAEACRMRRCQSFSQPRRGLLRESSPGSSTSSQTASLIGAERNVGGAEGNSGKLKEHRRKGRRAVTLHGLDREQLLLILSLQMRYLQESDQSAKREGATSNFSNGNNIGLRVTRSGQDNGDTSMIYGDMQRRAMTPTPRQERLSSSRTTDDDLDYRPAKLVRSHTPQPYHFKNSSQYNQIINNPLPQFQPYQIQPYLQQQPKLQPSPAQVTSDQEEEEELPTLITYDLRNVSKTGPIVYENIPSATSSLSYYNPEGLSSSSSPLLHSSHGTKQSKPTGKPTPGVLSQPPAEPMILGGNVQGVRSTQGQFSRQTSQVSVSSQPSIDSSPSDTRRLVPPKEKTPEPASAKTKGKKKLLKKDKNKKDDESPQAQPSGLTRTDSSASKGTVVADRWQALMEDGPKQAQTLWENVQRKIVSDPQTPDSTLDMRHPPLVDHQTPAMASGINSYATSQTLPRQNSFQSVSSLKQTQPDSLTSQPVRNGILKNAPPNYSTAPKVVLHNMPQNLPSPLNPSQNMHYPNPNPVHTTPALSNQYNSHYQNAFFPIANSSIDNYEDIDEVFPSIQQTNFIPSKIQYPADPHVAAAPAKPPRVQGKQVAKFGTHPKTIQPLSENPNQNLRPKSYMNAVDREAMGRSNYVDPRYPSSRGHNQGADLGQHMMTHLLMEGPVKDSTRLTEGNSHHFQVGSEYLYAQPNKKYKPGFEALPTSPDYNQVHIYQNPLHYPEGPRQFPEPQQRHPPHPQDNAHLNQWSAFQSLEHTQNPGPSFYEHPAPAHEICDTDLDDLPRPQHLRQHVSIHPYPSPPFTSPPVYHSLESVNRLSSTRSGSSSSCDPHNTSCASSQRSTTPITDLRGQAYHGNMNQLQLRGPQPTQVTDRRFCITQQMSNQL